MNVGLSRINVMKLVAHPTRIAIVEGLANRVWCVSDIPGLPEISQSNISQHLSALRHAGIIDYFVDGKLRCYFLKSPFVLDLLELIKKDYPAELPAPECCPAAKKGKYPGKRKR